MEISLVSSLLVDLAQIWPDELAQVRAVIKSTFPIFCLVSKSLACLSDADELLHSSSLLTSVLCPEELIGHLFRTQSLQEHKSTHMV